jgi:predicted enzyme related to lactoylglutathione lyase
MPAPARRGESLDVGYRRGHDTFDRGAAMSSVLVWADIPVVDLARASKFYEHVTGQPVLVMPETGDSVAVIGDPADGKPPMFSADLYVGGTPLAEGGLTIYFGTSGDLDGTLARVLEAGGEILQEKQNMGPMVGWIAFFKDTEGNRIGLQQPAE